VTEWTRSDQVLGAPGLRVSRGSLPEEVRPRGPLFFLSYAHAGRRGQPNRDVLQFFEDLSQDVAELVGWPAGSDPGFLDRSMAGGTHWPAELLNAVGTCKVFVPLLSDPYVASRWCGMEWYAFSRRTVTRHAGNGGDSETGIIPVIWTPVPEDRLPSVIGDIERFSPRGLPDETLPGRYADDGVYGLMRLGHLMDCRGIIWRLAQRIAEFHFGHEVAPLVLGRDDLHDVFRESTP